jgi:hypothetical protein
MYAPLRASATNWVTSSRTAPGSRGAAAGRRDGYSSASMRSRTATVPRRYKFHKAVLSRCSSSPVNLSKNSVRFIRVIGTNRDGTAAASAYMICRIGSPTGSAGVNGRSWVVLDARDPLCPVWEHRFAAQAVLGNG